MKIYNKIIINISTGETVYEDFYEHTGPKIECKGGGGSSTTVTVDKEYNAGMLELSREQQKWAGELYSTFKYGTTYDPNEQIRGAWIDGKWVDEADVPKGGRKIVGYEDTPEPETRGTPVSERSENWKRKEREKQLKKIPIYEDTPTYDIITITRGELMGYDPDAQTSEMDYTQNIIDANQSLLGEQTATELGYMELEQEKTKAELGLLPQQTELASAQMGSELKTLGLTDAQTAATLELLPQQTQLSQRDMESQMLSLGLTDAQTAATLGLLPQQTTTERSQLELGQAEAEANLGLLPKRTELESTQISDTLAGISQRAPVREKYYEETLEGVDPVERMNLAQADVAQGFADAEGIARRDAARMGKSAESLDFSGMATDRAKSVGLARTTARTSAKDESYKRLQSLMGLGG